MGAGGGEASTQPGLQAARTAHSARTTERRQRTAPSAREIALCVQQALVPGSSPTSAASEWRGFLEQLRLFSRGFMA